MIASNGPSYYLKYHIKLKTKDNEEWEDGSQEKNIVNNGIFFDAGSSPSLLYC